MTHGWEKKIKMKKFSFVTRVFVMELKNVCLKPKRQQAGPSSGTTERLAGTCQGFF